MVVQILNSLRNMIGSILGWIEAILDGTGGTMVVLSAIVIALVASLFIVPIRGGSGTFGTQFIGDFVKSYSYSGKYSNGKTTAISRPGKGKFEKRSYGKGGHERYKKSN